MRPAMRPRSSRLGAYFLWNLLEVDKNWRNSRGQTIHGNIRCYVNVYANVCILWYVFNFFLGEKDGVVCVAP